VWLAVCDPSDEAGLWTVAGLRRLGLDPLEVLLPAELTSAASITQRIGNGGGSLRIALGDGREIDGGSVRGVLNRLPAFPAGDWQRLPDGDRDYVGEEVLALLAGLFQGLGCPVLNPPEPLGLGGPSRTEAEWRLMAAAAGLDARPLHLTSWEEAPPPEPPERALAAVVGERVVGAPAELAEGCRALAGAARAPLLGIGFALDADGRWLVESATCQPDLRTGGREALEALGAALGA
jgi:hypothetical protein